MQILNKNATIHGKRNGIKLGAKPKRYDIKKDSCKCV